MEPPKQNNHQIHGTPYANICVVGSGKETDNYMKPPSYILIY